MRVLLIIPAYNEESNIENVVESVTRYKAGISDFDLDYLIVNDGSSDATGRICRDRRFNAIHLPCNLGIGGAVQAGYVFAKMEDYDIAVQFDGDGQHDISCLETLIAPIVENHADFAVGSRFIGPSSAFQSTRLRRIGIKLLSNLIFLCSGKRFTDVTSGFRAAGRDAIAFLAVDYPQDYPEPESFITLLRNGFNVCETPVNMLGRTGGASSIRSWKSIYYMIKVSCSIICAGFQKRRRK